MKISIICIGKTNAKYLREGENIYFKRLKHYINIDFIELNEPKGIGGSLPEVIKQKEADVFMKYLEQGKTNVLLDEQGEGLTSVSFAGFLEKHMNYSGGDINFFVGGAFGFSDKVYSKAQKKISLSPMTFSHQMVRLIFFEQLYRAFTIIKGEPYHNI